MLTAKFITLRSSRSALILSLPASAADSCSLRVLIRELGQLASGSGTDGGEEPLRYVQFSQWQNDLVEGDDETASKGREFWKKNADILPALQLPNESRSLSNFCPQSRSLTLENGIQSRVESVAARLGATAGEILFAAWQSLLWRLTGQSTFQVGTVFAMDGNTTSCGTP